MSVVDRHQRRPHPDPMPGGRHLTTVLETGPQGELLSLLGADAGTDTVEPPARNGASPPSPGWVEQWSVVITIFTLIHGLPIDWFNTRESWLEVDGNLKMVVVQIALMGFGIARVAGWFNWLIRAFRLDLTVLGLAGLALFSSLWSADPFETFKQAIILTVVTLYGTYLVLRFPLAKILELVATTFAIAGLINLGFVLLVPQYGIGEEALWDGVFFQKNALGFSALLAIPILLIVGRSGPSWRHLYYLCIPIQIALLTGSQSKTMLVATLGSVILLFVYRMFRSRKTLRGAVLLAILSISALTVAFATANIELLADWLDKDVTLTGRIPLWQALLPVALEQPILGFGYKAAFGGYFSPVHEVWVSEGWEPKHAHNAVLQMWLELGIPGVVLLVFGTFRAGLRALTMVATSVGAVALWPMVYVSTGLLISITESGIVHSLIGWMLFVVAALSAGRHTKELGGPLPQPVGLPRERTPATNSA